MQELGISYFVFDPTRVTVQGVCLVFPSTSIEKNAKVRNHGIFMATESVIPM